MNVVFRIGVTLMVLSALAWAGLHWGGGSLVPSDRTIPGTELAALVVYQDEEYQNYSQGQRDIIDRKTWTDDMKVGNYLVLDKEARLSEDSKFSAAFKELTAGELPAYLASGNGNVSGTLPGTELEYKTYIEAVK